MIGLLEDVRNREEVSLDDEELDLQGQVVDDGEVQADWGNAAGRSKLEPADDALSMYFTEVGRTKMLADGETRVLSRQIEDEKHLAGLVREVSGEDGSRAAAAEVLSVLLGRVGSAHEVFEALYRHLDLPLFGRVSEGLLHPDLRDAIDDKIESHLSDAVAELTGTVYDVAEKAILDLSLNSRLIPWHIVDALKEVTSVAELGEMAESTEFTDVLEICSGEIADHFAGIRERARLAAERMVQANLRLVARVAKGHMGWGVPMSDLIQEGNLGLMHAVRKFDHRRGYRFSTYAVPWIWQAINRAANDQSRVVRLPGYLADDLTRLIRVRTGLTQRLGRQPTERELVSEAGLRSDRVQSLLKLKAGSPVSYDMPIGEDGARLGDFIADRAALKPDEETDAKLLKEGLSKTLESLTPRERRVIELRFGLDEERSRTLKEVGVELGLTKERVRQIEKQALAKLRHPSHSRELIGYLG